MGQHSDLIAADLDGIDNVQEMAGHLRAVASLTPTQLAGMLGWTQQEQDRDAYRVAFELFHQARLDDTVLNMMVAPRDACGQCNEYGPCPDCQLARLEAANEFYDGPIAP